VMNSSNHATRRISWSHDRRRVCATRLGLVVGAANPEIISLRCGS
jgi:hypothetical protein